MTVLKIIAADSDRGRKWVTKLQGRAAAVLDRKTQRAAARIVDDVRRRGDEGLLEAVRGFDGVDVEDVSELRLRPKLEDERAFVPAGFAEALEGAILAVERYHAAQSHAGFHLDLDGVRLEERRLPLARVGLYVPGGRAVYPSSVVMTVVPARIAGVREIVVATPPAAFGDSPALRYTLARLGVEEIWGMGGAHAIAALAHGTATIGRVDKILGPGNAWVTAAKQAVSGAVAIDGLAGPSEVVIVAERGSDAAWVAADLLAQAEHDPRAAAVLITDSRALGRAVNVELLRQLATLPTADTARAALRAFGAVLLVEKLELAAPLIEAIAPEHLQLVGPRSEALAAGVRNAGAIFLGPDTPEVFGDYLAGPSHVLPTCGTARFASALGVEDFVRRSHVVRFDRFAAARAAGAAGILADAEGLPAHALSARRRQQ